MNTLKLFSGYVRHVRTMPKEHRFRYKADSIWINLQEISELDDISPFWSTQRFNLMRFHRHHYLPSDRSLYDQACLEINKRCGEEFKGDIFLLANISCWGHCFNPISFFFCFRDQQLCYLMAEVHNTPWGERSIYLHKIGQQSSHQAPDQQPAVQEQTVEFDKNLHVSPFMPMDLKYRWRYKLSQERFKISKNLHKGDSLIFNATLDLRAQELSPRLASQLPFRKPFMSLSILPRIYWQALKLWLKKIPIFKHSETPTL